MSGVSWIDEGVSRDLGVVSGPFAFLGVPLPSERSAAAVVAGESGGLATLLLHYIGRAALLGTGFFIAGARADLLKMSAAAAGAIEAVLLAEAASGKSALPTGENGTDVIRGEPGAIPTMLAYTVARSVLIGAGLAAVGVRGTDLVKYSLAGSAAVEAFVLSYAWMDERKQDGAK